MHICIVVWAQVNVSLPVNVRSVPGPGLRLESTEVHVSPVESTPLDFDLSQLDLPQLHHLRHKNPRRETRVADQSHLSSLHGNPLKQTYGINLKNGFFSIIISTARESSIGRLAR